MHRCHWPGCEKQVNDNRALCYRHFARLPENIKRWVGAVYGKDDKQTPRAIGAVRQYARKNPDPDLPPFRNGQLVQGKDGIFSACRYTVDHCVLTDGGQWVVIVADTGDQFPASELVLVRP